MSIFEELEKISGLISLPEVYLKIRQLMDDEHSDIYDFAEVISIDPNFTATILKIVNSSLFGFSGQIDNIPRAINMLGIGQVHDIALGTSAVSSLNIKNEVIDLKDFWRVSLLTGVLSRSLARQLKLRNFDRLFAVGLLHDIGHLILYSNYPQQTLKIMESLASKTSGQIIPGGERPVRHSLWPNRRLYHVKMAVTVFFQMVTEFQPDPESATENKTESWLVHLCRNQALKAFQIGSLGIEDPDSSCYDRIGLSKEELNAATENALNQSRDMEKALLAGIH